MIRMVDLILKKREGQSLSRQEIAAMIQGYTDGTIPDYQMSAFAMAVFFRGMTSEEVALLTMAMAESGDMIDLSAINGIKVDKHSTGGVGDKVSLIVGPLVASVGIPVAKMSGRGLGHTGGTIDKLESIPGFKVELTKQAFTSQVNRHKIAIIGQSGNITPADKMLYGLRDVTATVDSIPLIASSIMSKKIASGADAIVLDVKTGAGAFMKTLSSAKQLAETMVAIGNNLNRKTVAVISDMNQPLGFEIGNANEVKEAIGVLKGEAITDLREVSITIASHMTVLGGIYPDYHHAFKALTNQLDGGAALETLKTLIKAQGGDANVVDDPALLPQASHHTHVVAQAGGYIAAIEAEKIGIAAMMLGAGRKTKADQIDYAAGITLSKKIGDQVSKGDTLAVLHHHQPDASESEQMVLTAFTMTEQHPKLNQMIYEVMN